MVVLWQLVSAMTRVAFVPLIVIGALVLSGDIDEVVMGVAQLIDTLSRFSG